MIGFGLSLGFTGFVGGGSDPMPPVTDLTMVQLENLRVYQRATTTGSDFAVGAGTVALSVTSDGSGIIYARLRDANTEAVIKEPFAVGSVTAGTRSINIPVPARLGWYLLDIAPSADGPWTLGTSRIGMGRVIAFMGQSQAAIAVGLTGGWGGLGITPPANGSLLARYRWGQGENLAPEWGLTNGGSGSYRGAFAGEILNRQIAASGVNCAIVGCAEGGATVATFLPGAENGINLFNVLAAVGGWEAMIVHIGGSDFTSGTLPDDYASRLHAILDAVTAANAVRGSDYQLVVTAMASRQGTISEDVLSIRIKAEEVADMRGGVYLEPRDVALVDTVHQTQAGNVTLARATDLALTGAHHPPEIIEVTRDGAVLTLIGEVHAPATQLALQGLWTSRIRVYAEGNATQLPISNLTTSGTTITATLASDPGDVELTVWIYRHPDPGSPHNHNIHDNYTIPRHLRPSTAPFVIPASGPPPVLPYQEWPGPGWFDASDASTVSLHEDTNIPLGLINRRSGGGDLESAGAVSHAYVEDAQNGLSAVRITRNVSVAANLPRMVAASGAPLSQMFHGSNRPFTVIAVYKPLDANTGFFWSVGNNPGYTSLIRRADSSTIRKGSNAQTYDVNFEGQAANSPRIIVVTYNGTHTSVWNTSLTKTIDTQPQNELPVTSTPFCLFAQQTSTVYSTVQFSTDFYEMVVENRVVSDANIQMAITDLADKWGIDLLG